MYDAQSDASACPYACSGVENKNVYRVTAKKMSLVALSQKDVRYFAM